VDGKPDTVHIEPGSMTGLHQFVHRMDSRSDLGRQILAIRDLLRSAGLRSEIFGFESASDNNSDSFDFGQHLLMAAGSGIVYHLAGPSPLAPYVYSRPEPLLVWHHGLADPKPFSKWGWSERDRLADAYADLGLLSKRCCLGLASSVGAEDDMVACGYFPTVVVGDDALWLPAPTGRSVHNLSAQWLTATPLVPGSGVDRVVEAFAVYIHTFDASAKLAIVGDRIHERYFSAIVKLVESLRLKDSVRFIEAGLGDDESMKSFGAADAYLDLSGSGVGISGIVRANQYLIPVVVSQGTSSRLYSEFGALVLELPVAQAVAQSVWRFLKTTPVRDNTIELGGGSTSREKVQNRLIKILQRVTGDLRAAV